MARWIVDVGVKEEGSGVRPLHLVRIHKSRFLRARTRHTVSSQGREVLGIFRGGTRKWRWTRCP